MKKYFFLIFIFSIIPLSLVFADTVNTGFIPGTIWYSKLPLVEGNKVKVYTVVWNGDSDPLQATVQFYDQNVILGSRDIVVPAQSLKDVSVLWQVTAGDHVISAKIISSKITSAGKVESMVLNKRATGEDRQFVSKVIKEIDGTPVSSTAVIKDQVSEVGSKITSVLPTQVGVPLSDAFSSIDKFRDETFTQIVTNKDAVNKQIALLGSESKAKNAKTITQANGIDGTEKPIALIKVFFLSVLGFVFGNKIVFYGLCALIVFIILRYIFRKIRNR